MLPLSCFWTIVVITHASRCGVASISLQSSRTPFLSALLAVEPSLRHRYFFPGHSNAFIPPAFDGLTSIRDVFQYDLPELDGLDNIHAPEGPLLEALELAAQHFQVSKTWFLVNGSTSGILTAILSCFRIFKQSKIATTTQPTTTTGYFLIGRDAHKSVYDAVELTGCNSIVLPCHVDSVCGISLGVDFSTLEATLLRYENQICGLVFTRPTYHGVGCSTQMLNDVASLCHRYHVPVVVDEAHGSHLHLLNRQDFQSAVASQADVVVQSTHKTLNSLSQTAMMHLPHRAFSYQSNLDAQHVQRLVHKTFSSLTTTSPNAILLASLDATRSHAATEGLSLAARSVAAVNDIKQAVRSHPQAAVLLEDSADVIRHGLLVDPLRLTIHYAAENNQAVDDCMCEDDGIYCELNEMGCIAYNIPVFATSNYLSPLRNAILKSLERIQQQNPMEVSVLLNQDGKPITVELEHSFGSISADTICVYPPGIPVLIKGEVISVAHIDRLRALRCEMGSGMSITGASDITMVTLAVLEL